MIPAPPAPVPVRANPLQARLQQYIRWTVPPGIGFAIGLFALYAWVPEPLILILACIVTLNVVGVLFAYRRVGQGDFRTAIAVQALGMLAIALFVGEGGPAYFQFTAMLGFLAIVLAIPYVTPRALVVLTLASVAVVCAVGLSLASGWPNWRVEIPERHPHGGPGGRNRGAPGDGRVLALAHASHSGRRDPEPGGGEHGADRVRALAGAQGARAHRAARSVAGRARRGARRSAARESTQICVPGQHVARAAHPAERDHRLLRGPAREAVRRDERRSRRNTWRTSTLPGSTCWR